MKYKLSTKTSQMTVNSMGAYIERMTIDDVDVFFPNVQFCIDGKLKVRGGMHPCLPQFGKDELFNLPQHGYGREISWQVKEITDHTISLLQKNMKGYEDVTFTIKYILKEDSLITELDVKNESEKTAFIAPGFHPYFYSRNRIIEIANVDMQKLKDTEYVKSKDVSFKLSENEILIKGHNIGQYAVWTDFYGEYICVEPTYNGPSFNQEKQYLSLKKGEHFKMQFEIIRQVNKQT